MSGFLEVYLLAAVVLFLAVTVVWLISLVLRDSSIIDVFWGLGFILVCWIYFFRGPFGYLPRQLLLSALVTLWGLRLSVYILWRNWGRGEDFRYRKWREEAEDAWWWRSYFKVFLLQGALIWVISAPLLAAQIQPAPRRLTILDGLGLVLWLIGFAFESVGDYQLARFKANPANRHRVMQAGLWRYTRHPNYFGDAVQWWGFYLFALAVRGGGWTVFSPVLMTVLLLRVSGVAMLESALVDRKPGYEAYRENTPAFFPWFPKGD